MQSAISPPPESPMRYDSIPPKSNGKPSLSVIN